MTDAITILRELLAVESLWLDSATVGMRIDAAAGDPKKVASQARRERRILGVWDGERFRYPAFQFEPGGGPRPKTSDLVGVLPRERDGTIGVAAALWMFWPDWAFDGKAPAEVFAEDPDLVINEARIRREGGRG